MNINYLIIRGLAITVITINLFKPDFIYATTDTNIGFTNILGNAWLTIWSDLFNTKEDSTTKTLAAIVANKKLAQTGLLTPIQNNLNSIINLDESYENKLDKIKSSLKEFGKSVDFNGQSITIGGPLAKGGVETKNPHRFLISQNQNPSSYENAVIITESTGQSFNSIAQEPKKYKVTGWVPKP